MDDLGTKLNKLFQQNFPGSSTALETVQPFHSQILNSDVNSLLAPPMHRIGGFLVWEKFDGLSMRERQRQVWETLRKNLTSEEQQHVSAVLTLTPLEERVMLENE